MLFESLETRRHFSVSIVNGILTVSGTPYDDQITINVNPVSLYTKTITNTTTVTITSPKGTTTNSFPTSTFSGIAVTGGDGNDRVEITGNCTRPSTLSGDAGNDTLLGGGGSDKMLGGDGNDLLDGRGGADIFNGGSGADTADYSHRTAAVAVTADGVAGDDGQAGEGDNVNADVETILGGAGNDTLSGGSAFIDNVLYGNGGNDRLNGGFGDDVLYGGAGNDTLCGDAGNDTCYGETGDDHLDDYQAFMNESEDFGNDVYSGGDGIDTISYQLRNEGVHVTIDNFADDGFNVTNQHLEFDNVLTDVENLYGTRFSDELHGSAAANEIQGGLGDDSIWGEGGHDRLFGGADNDDIQAGMDGQGCYLDGGLGRDTLVGGTGDDTFIANDGTRDTIVSGGGNDVLTVDAIDVVR
jgi:Ca2+-binding RTX toxin-like protein